MRFKCCLLLVVSCLFLVGCAKTVTQVVTYGTQMTVEVTLRGTMEVDANRYFMVLADNPSFKIPLPPPDNPKKDEFIEPGTQPFLGGDIADYYINYYSTWSGYVVVDPGGFSSVKGPFVQTQAITRELFASLGEINTKIRFTFSLDRIFGATIPDTIYFDFVSVNWPTGAQKLSADHLFYTNAYISKVSGSTVTVTDGEYEVIDPALNILSCVVTIQ